MSSENPNDDIPHIRKEPRPDFSKPPPPKRLPKEIQATLDDEEKLWRAVYEGEAAESTESNVRYAAYAARVRTILRSVRRYVAYTSDIGESFRPVAHPHLVRGAYAVSWLYIGGDVAHEGYKAYIRNQKILHPDRYFHADGTAKDTDAIKAAVTKEKERGPGLPTSSVLVPGTVSLIEDYRAVMAERAIFQSLASMGLPAFTIHSVVKYSGRAMKDMKNKTFRTWGPIGLGLAVVPFLPYLFDEPVEKAVSWAFHKGFEAWGGPEAVKRGPITEELAMLSSSKHKKKEKEL